MTDEARYYKTGASLEVRLACELAELIVDIRSRSHRSDRPAGGKPVSRPRPIPITVGDVDPDWQLQWLFEHGRFYEHLAENEPWLCLKDRSTDEIYTALFNRVDPRGASRDEGMDLLNDELYKYGFRTISEGSNDADHVWFLPDEVRLGTGA